MDITPKDLKNRISSTNPGAYLLFKEGRWSSELEKFLSFVPGRVEVYAPCDGAITEFIHSHDIYGTGVGLTPKPLRQTLSSAIDGKVVLQNNELTIYDMTTKMPVRIWYSPIEVNESLASFYVKTYDKVNLAENICEINFEAIAKAGAKTQFGILVQDMYNKDVSYEFHKKIHEEVKKGDLLFTATKHPPQFKRF